MMKYCLILFVSLFIYSNNYTQSLTGMSGLLSVPTSELNKDRTIIVGTNYLNKKYLAYTKENYSAFDIYITMAYLHFLELGVRVTRVPNLPEGSHHNVDRMFSFRLRLIEEGFYVPSVAVGANNPLSTREDANHFNSLYVVTTKSFQMNSILQNISFTLGYGSDIIKAADHEFIGVFGGISFQISDFLDLISEYDANHLNGGIKILLLDHFHFLLCWKGYKYFNGGFAFQFRI